MAEANMVQDVADGCLVAGGIERRHSAPSEKISAVINGVFPKRDKLLL